MAEPQGFRQNGPARLAGPLAVDEVAERAAKRLDVTVERVLEQLRAIGFADIRRVVDWNDGTLVMKPSGELLDGDAAAIAEIVASAKDQKIYRVKMHDKTPALALMTRILERLNKQDEQTDDDSEEARDFLLEELDRLSAEIAVEEDNREPAETDHPEGAQ
jgi:hypothetical protein